MSEAVAYYRTSSAANVGEGKDSLPRQRAACQDHADRNGLTIVREYYDADVRGSDPVGERPGFAKLMDEAAAKVILVENASRFARDLIVQETGYQYLQGHGISLIAVDDPDAFTADTPTAIMVRQILGAVSQFEKSNLVAKMAAARARKRAETGRCEGRKPTYTIATVELARTMKDKPLRKIADELAAAGHLCNGRVYGPESVKRMLAN